MISSCSENKYITKAKNLEARTFLAKPFPEAQLAQFLQHYNDRDASAPNRTGAVIQ